MAGQGGEARAIGEYIPATLIAVIMMNLIGRNLLVFYGARESRVERTS